MIGKYKFCLGILMVITLSIYSHAKCTKSEVMKLIDKGFSKTEVSNICGLNKETSTPAKKANKWLTPENSICRSNGGNLHKGICKATWHDAKAICRVSGGRLPTIEELKEVVIDCGGAINATKENREDPNYQSCYKGKGFFSSYDYWSSTLSTYHPEIGYAWDVYFISGTATYRPKRQDIYVRCVKDRQ